MDKPSSWGLWRRGSCLGPGCNSEGNRAGALSPDVTMNAAWRKRRRRKRKWRRWGERKGTPLPYPLRLGTQTLPGHNDHSRLITENMQGVNGTWK